MYKFLCVLGLLFAHIAVQADTKLILENVWIRQGPPNSKVVSGYLTIHNHHQHDVILSGVDSEIFSSIEFHRTRIVDGVAKMRRKKRLTIPAQGTLELKPGSYHLMLFKPEIKLEQNATVPLTFLFESHNSLTVAASIKR